MKARYHSFVYCGTLETLAYTGVEKSGHDFRWVSRLASAPTRNFVSFVVERALAISCYFGKA